MSAMIEKEATGRPKGVALIEFDKEEARRVALTLSGDFISQIVAASNSGTAAIQL